MTRITGDDFMLIGLQEMASGRGEGPVPEVMDVLRGGRESFDDGAGLLHLAERRAQRALPSAGASNENNVIVFPLARRSATRR